MAEPTDIIQHDEFDPAVQELYESQLARQDEEDDDIAASRLRRRKEAYARVFSAGERSQDDIDIVMNDLMWFCRMFTPTYDINDGVHAEELSKRKEGRREVFQRIREHTRLDMDTLLVLYTGAITR